MLKIDPDEAVYVISVVSKLTGVPPKTLRLYDEKGILSPKRTPKNQRLYSQRDVEKLRYLVYLSNLKHVNIAGLQEIIKILEHVPPEIREELMQEAETEIENIDNEHNQ